MSPNTPPTHIPSPISEQRGWPWDSDIAPAPELVEGTSAWPRITIVTPSYNQGQFIEETIRSILLQRYPNLEYFVMDGGSTDRTVEIIKRYEPWIDHWESEQDRGQSHAINKGWQRSTGSVLAWLNSDDTFLPGALAKVARAFISADNVATVTGVTRFAYTDEREDIVVTPRPFDALHFLRGGGSSGQPAVFIARSTWETTGDLDESLHYSMDRDYWLRISIATAGSTHLQIRDELANAKLWEENKATHDPDLFYSDHMKLFNKAFSSPDLPEPLQRVYGGAMAAQLFRHAMRCRDAGQYFKAIRLAIKSWFRHPRISRLWKVTRFVIGTGRRAVLGGRTQTP